MRAIDIERRETVVWRARSTTKARISPSEYNYHHLVYSASLWICGSSQALHGPPETIVSCKVGILGQKFLPFLGPWAADVQSLEILHKISIFLLEAACSPCGQWTFLELVRCLQCQAINFSLLNLDGIKFRIVSRIVRGTEWKTVQCCQCKNLLEVKVKVKLHLLLTESLIAANGSQTKIIEQKSQGSAARNYWLEFRENSANPPTKCISKNKYF